MKINRQLLLNTLKAVQPATTSRETYTQSSFFCFKNKRVYSFNNELAVSAPINIDVECAVPAQEFIAILSKITTDDVTIEIDKGELIIEANKIVVGLKIQDKVRIPIDDFNIEDAELFTLPDNFSEAVAFCNFTASKDRTKPKLCNVHVVNDYVESCDNQRVTRYTLSDIIGQELLIPISASTHLPRYNPVEFFTTQGWIHFINVEDVMFSCRVDMDSYVDLNPFLQVEGEEVEFPDEMVDGLERASVILKTQEQEYVTVTIQKGNILLDAEGKSGWFNEEFEINSDVEVEFTLHPTFFKSILKLCTTAVVGENMVWFEGKDFIHAVVQVRS